MPHLFILSRFWESILPLLRDTEQSRKGQFQTALLIKKSRNDLASPPLLLKGPFQKVRHSDRLVIKCRAALVIQRGLQILFESLHDRRIYPLVFFDRLDCHLFRSLKVLEHSKRRQYGSLLPGSLRPDV